VRTLRLLPTLATLTSLLEFLLGTGPAGAAAVVYDFQIPVAQGWRAGLSGSKSVLWMRMAGSSEGAQPGGRAAVPVRGRLCASRRMREGWGRTLGAPPRRGQVLLVFLVWATSTRAAVLSVPFSV